MTTREKIIVGLMCLTILYGAYDLLGNKGHKKGLKVHSTDAVKELKDFAASVTNKLVNEKVSKEYRYLITQAANDWNKDPFIHSTTPLKTRMTLPDVPLKPADRSHSQYLYTGFLKLGATKLAVINGIEYAEGETLNRDGLYIKSISPQKVVIGKVNGKETIQVPIAESGPPIVN